VGVEPSPGRQFVAVVAQGGRAQLDLLVVVDDSSTMEVEQRALTYVLGEELFAPFEQLPSLHIGVTSTNMGGDADPMCAGRGDDGRLFTESSALGCERLSLPGGFLSDIPLMNGSRLRNFDMEIADALGCMVQLGTAGCGFEQPFAAAMRATDPAVNPDFLRSGAVLAVLFLTDEDDCSARSPELFADEPCTDPSDPGQCPLGPLSSFRCFEHGVRCDQDVRSPGDKTDCEVDQDAALMLSPREVARALRRRKSDPRDVVVGVLAAPGAPISVSAIEGASSVGLTPSCTSEDGASGTPALRMAALVDEFPGQGTSSSVCELSTGGALRRFGTLVRDTLEGRPCLRGALADVDVRAGLQPSCAAFDVTDYGSTESRWRSIPSCSTASAPCFELVASDECAHTESGLAAIVERTSPAAPDTTLVVECQLED